MTQRKKMKSAITPAHMVRSFLVRANEEKTLKEIIDSESKINSPIKTEIRCEKHSKVQYIFLLDTTFKENFSEQKTFIAKEGSELEIFLCYLGGQNNSVKISVHLSKNAKIKYSTFFIADGEQNFSFEEEYFFEKPESVGHFSVRGLVLDNAVTKSHGNIVVQGNAQKTESRLEMEGIMVGKKARCSMIPSLEIKANDVKAGHAAKISHIDSESLFYLRSRGLKTNEAKKLFLEGMMLHFAGTIKDFQIKEKIIQTAGQKISLYQ